jgi:hypothetical protein
MNEEHRGQDGLTDGERRAARQARAKRFLDWRASISEGPEGKPTLNDFIEDLEEAGFTDIRANAWLARYLGHEHLGWEAHVTAPDIHSDRFRYRFIDGSWQNGRFGRWFESLPKLLEYVVDRSDERIEALEKQLHEEREAHKKWVELMTTSMEDR